MGFSKNWIYFCLVILILLGVFLRVDSISSNYLLPDEPHIMTSALKFHHEGFLEGATYSADHPPLAKWVMGLSTISSESDFSVLVFVKMGMRVYSLLSIEPIKQNYVSMLYISLLMGVLFLVFVFLLTWKIFNLDSALWATALVSLSAQLITYSRHVFFENYFLAFLVIGLFFYYLFLDVVHLL